jgi:prepilin-type processing-associated H-X9-DG protein
MDAIAQNQNLDLGIYHCPADKGATTRNHTSDEQLGSLVELMHDSGMSAYDHFGTSYGAASFLVVGGVMEPFVQSTAPFGRPLSRIPNAANTVLFQEANGLYAWNYEYRKEYGPNGCNPQPSDCPYGHGNPALRVKGWHGKDWRFTVAFVDGHAGVIRMEGADCPPTDLGDTYPDDGSTRPPYLQFRCITLRGPGWQLDTLPSPPISLGLTTQQCGIPYP